MQQGQRTVEAGTTCEAPAVVAVHDNLPEGQRNMSYVRWGHACFQPINLGETKPVRKVGTERASMAAGGLECWDRRRAGKPQLRSPLSWGLTGSGALDAAQVNGNSVLRFRNVTRMYTVFQLAVLQRASQCNAAPSRAVIFPASSAGKHLQNC